MARATASWLTGIGGFLFLLELVFRVLPVSTSTETGYYIDPLILTYPPHHRWVMSTGWDLRNAQTLEANNLGYSAGRDFVRDEHAVALIGDSFIEASMLPAADRPGAQLERALDSRPVYAMGNPGTALLDYAERIRFAHEQLGTRDFVILMERGDVMQSLCGSGNINGPCLDPTTLAPRNEVLPPAGVAKRILRHSALAQYLFSQLKFNSQRLWGRPVPSAQPMASSASIPAIDAVTKAFFERVKPHILGRLVIVIDCDRNALNHGQSPVDPGRQRFIQLARSAGARVVDTELPFKAHLAQSPLKLEIGPYDQHLNRLGISIVAQAVADMLDRH